MTMICLILKLFLRVIFCLSIHALLSYSESEQESEQESEKESEHESEQDSEQWEEYASIVVYSNGINLSAAQTGTMNEIIAERGLGMGAVLVHELTKTDMSHTGLV
jgi:hypothetical protein